MMGTDLGTDTPQLRGLYFERAHLLAVLAARFPARLAHNDPGEPGLPVLYLDTPAGQVCFHINPEHLGLFAHVPWAAGDPGARWDGHDKAEALRRLRHLARPADPAEIEHETERT